MLTTGSKKLCRISRMEMIFAFVMLLGWSVESAGAFTTAAEAAVGASKERLFQTQLFGFQRTPEKRKRKRESKIRKLSASNDLMTNHKERIATAGKEGTLRYTDPTMIFIGNLNFTATEDELKSLILPLVPSPWDIAKAEIVRDWKTGDSKGYAFVRFTEPMYATLCLQELNGKQYLGRQLKASAAKSKSESPLRQKQRAEQMRMKALRRAQNPPPPPPEPKHENAEFLAFLDRDLIVPSLDDDGDDDDDDEVDGWEVPGSPAPKGFG